MVALYGFVEKLRGSIPPNYNIDWEHDKYALGFFRGFPIIFTSLYLLDSVGRKL